MNYATKIKTAMASVLCVMVGMAFAGTTVTNDVQTYGATFESSTGADNDFAYEAGQKIANYTNELGTAGWFAGSEDDESVISNRTAAVEGLGSQYLLLNTDAETLTNKLDTTVKAGVNTAMAGGARVDASLYDGNVATYEGAVFESDVKFVASDTLDAGIPGGQDATKFAIYAYCNEDADPVTTNLVVFHAVRPKRGAITYTNYVFSSVDIDTTAYTHLKVVMKQVSNADKLYDVFSVTVGSGDNAVTLENEFASEVRFGDAATGNWFFTVEDAADDSKQVSSLNFKGTGEIDNIKISQKVKETYAAIVDGVKYETWATAAAAAIANNKLLESYEAASLQLAAEEQISVTNIQPTVTTVAGYRVDDSTADGVTTYVSVLDKATVIFLAYDGTTVLYSNDFTIGTAPTFVGSTDRTADADGVYTFTGWTANETLYGPSDTLPNVALGGATYTATYSTVASAASVNGTYYATLADAISAATGTEYPVVLNDDVALSSTIIITDDVTIDLNDHDIAATGCRAIWVKSGNVLITGEGNVTAEGPGLGATSSVIRVGDGAANANIAALTVNTNVTVASATCYGVTVFGKNNDGNNATTDITFDLYGTVEVSAPYVAHGCDAAISGNGNSGNSAVDITIHDGAVVTSDNANGIYFPSAGTLAIEGGTITGATAVYAKAGNIDISGGTLVATGTKAAYAATGDGANPTGDAIVIDNCGYPSGLSLDVAVTGGDVSSAYGDPIGSFATGSGHEPKDGFVSGGTFDAPLADDLCAEGFIPVTEPNGDGKYEVTPGGTVTFKNGDVVLFTTNVVNGGTAVYEGAAPTKAADASGLYTWAGWNDGTNDYATDAALAVMNSADQTYTATFSKSGDAKATVISVAGTQTYFGDFASAFAAAGNGDTVKLLDDDTATWPTVAAGNSKIIDLNGHTLTANVDVYGELTLTNSVPSTGKLAGTVYVDGTITDSENVVAHFTLAEDTIIESKYGIILWPTNNKAYDAVIDIYGTINGCVWVYGTVTEGDSVINVYGTVDGSYATWSDGAAVGIALNGKATVNVYDGAYITASDAVSGRGTGIEVRAGDLNVTGGTIVGTGDGYVFNPNGSGTTSYGVGIAVAQHTTTQNINVNVQGGAVTGVVAFATSNPQQNNSGALDVDITGGEFVGTGTGAIAVDSDDARINGFVSGGTFSSVVNDEYAADGFIPVTEPNANGKYEVERGGTVTFVNYDGTELYKTNVANGGTAVYEGATPVKPADASGVYTFNGWDSAIVAVNSADQTYTATFSKSGDAKATVITITDAGATTNVVDYYATVTAALEAAATGDTVVVLADTNERVYATVNNNVTLDINGKTMTSPVDDVIVKNGTGTLTIVDTAATPGLVQSTINGVDLGVAVWARQGKVIINSGVFENNSNYEATLYVSNGAYAEVNGGTFRNVAEGEYHWKSGWAPVNLNVQNGHADKANSIVVSGGSFSADPQYGDDSLKGEGDFTDEGYVAIVEDGKFVVQAGYNVTFDADGGTPAPEAQRVAAGGTATAPADPSKADGAFAGWTLDGNAYDFDTVLDADITLVATYEGYVAQIVGGASYTSLQAALDAAKENNLQQANIELLANASITISRNGNVLGGNSTTNITINGNGYELNVIRNGTWAQFNTANANAELVISNITFTSEFSGTATGWASEPLQNPNHNIAFNCVVTLKDVVSDNALSFWKDATLDTVTVSDSANVYPIWIHTTADEISINNLTVNSMAVGRGIKVDDSYVSGWGGTPTATTEIDINNSTFNMDKVRKSAVLVGSAYPVVITQSGNDITNVGADTENLVWVDERDSAAQNYGLVSVNGEQPGIEGGSSNFAASYSTNGTWIAGYYKVLADAVAIADADDTLTLQKNVTETFTVAKELTITLNGFTAENVTAGEGYTRTVTETTYVFAEAATGFNAGDDVDGVITQDQADWLNAFIDAGTYTKAQLEGLTGWQSKYLLNVDPFTGSGTLTVTGITVGGQVKVTVTLARTEGGTAVGTREINGVLELWGTTGLGSSTPFAKLAAATISDADFSEGNTQEITFEGSAKFFKAYIVEPTAAVEP